MSAVVGVQRYNSDAAADTIVRSFIATNVAFEIQADGRLDWRDGAGGAVDVSLYRSGAGALTVSGTIAATSFLGNATTATTATTATDATNAANVGITQTETGAGPYYLTFVDATSGNLVLRVDTGITYNATTNNLDVDGLVSAVTATVATAPVNPTDVARLTEIDDLQAQIDETYLYVHTQVSASTSWVVDHGSTNPPAAIFVVDNTGVSRYPEIQHDTPIAGQATLVFTTARAGIAYVHVLGGGGGGGGGGTFEISALPDAGAVADADLLAISQSGNMRKVAVSALRLALAFGTMFSALEAYAATAVIDGSASMVVEDP